jgi:hypothetical protein
MVIARSLSPEEPGDPDSNSLNRALIAAPVFHGSMRLR